MPYPPSIKQVISSALDYLDDLTSSRGTNSSLGGYSYFTNPVNKFVVMHEVNNTDKVTLETFYIDNRYTSFNFTYTPTGNTYVCVFNQAPVFESLGYGFWRVTMYLSEKI